MKFDNISPSGSVDCFVLLKTVEKKTSAKGGFYLDATIADKSGEMNAKLWDYSEAVHGVYEAGNLVKLRGTVSEYRGVNQFRIDRIRLVLPEDGVDINDFVPSTGFNEADMWNELYNIADAFADADLKAIVTTILKDKKEQMLYWPAAFKMHHAVKGGLLCHTLSIVRLAEAVCRVYTFADRELLLAGVILHDIGKIEEFELNSTGLVSGYSPKGNLVGHLVSGAVTVEKTAEKLGITSDVPMLLSHMLISHHGDPEFGAAVLPQFLEAELLSQLDMMDATVFEICEATEDVKSGETTGRIFGLDNRKLYNHGRTSNKYDPKIF
ncbi:MAG: HDIG domain-containing protein [Clostridia bacterium]|nr:HDIG domain-containing protein [Clostridia bacterium]